MRETDQRCVRSGRAAGGLACERTRRGFCVGAAGRARRVFGGFGLVVVVLTCQWPAHVAADQAGSIEEPAAGHQYDAWPWPLDALGYEQSEFFVSGIAQPGDVQQVLPSLVLGSGHPEPFKTRVQLYRPIDPSRFNGTVIAEWVNVSGQFEMPTAWLWAHRDLMREGYAYAAISAQEAGVCGNKSPVPGVEVCAPTSLKGAFPQRYATLHHPGDIYSFDIFGQAVGAVRDSAISMVGAPVRNVIAVGESQSAILIDQYICSPFDAAREIDGLLSDADLGRALACSPRVPVIQLWGEESAVPVAQTESANNRIWMIAGAPHGDRGLVQYVAPLVTGNLGLPPPTVTMDAFDVQAGRYGEEGLVAGADAALCAPDGDEFPRRYVVAVALEALARWVRSGVPAPTVPSFVFSAVGLAGRVSPTSLAVDYEHDEFGNVSGGLRLPVLDVPVAQYIGSTCVVLGQTIPFDHGRLLALYGNHAEYVRRLHASAEQSVLDGLFLPADAADLMRRACASPVAGGPQPGEDCPSITANSPYDVHPAEDLTAAAAPDVALPGVDANGSASEPPSLPATGRDPATVAPLALCVLGATGLWLARRTRNSAR